MLSGAFKRAGVTATAGATSELSRILIDTAVMGNSSEFDLEVKRLRTEGMSAEEAWRQTFTDYVERVVDTGVRSGRYGLIAGLSEYGGEYFRQHPEAFNALVSGKTGWSGGMQGLTPGGAQGLLGLPGATLAPGGRMEGMPMLPGPAAVKDDWETALEEAVTEWKESGMGRPEPESIDISGENGIIFNKDTRETDGWFTLPDPAAEGNISVGGPGNTYNPINKGPLPDKVANTFRSGTYTEVVTQGDTTLYRVYGGKAGELGPYWTTTKPQGPLQSVIDSALDQNWGNTATNVTTIKVPQGTTIYQGYAASQGGLVGGGTQVYIPKVDPSWIVK